MNINFLDIVTQEDLGKPSRGHPMFRPYFSKADTFISKQNSDGAIRRRAKTC